MNSSLPIVHTMSDALKFIELLPYKSKGLWLNVRLRTTLSGNITDQKCFNRMTNDPLSYCPRISNDEKFGTNYLKRIKLNNIQPYCYINGSGSKKGLAICQRTNGNSTVGWAPYPSIRSLNTNLLIRLIQTVI